MNKEGNFVAAELSFASQWVEQKCFIIIPVKLGYDIFDTRMILLE